MLYRETTHISLHLYKTYLTGIGVGVSNTPKVNLYQPVLSGTLLLSLFVVVGGPTVVVLAID